MIHAGRLGNLTAAGHYPYSIPYSDVSRVMLERRNEALRRVKSSEADFARQCRAMIWPNRKAQPRADGNISVGDFLALNNIAEGLDALPHLPADAVALWGNDVLTTSALKFPTGTCKTCFARTAARVHETLPPRDTEAHRELLGPACGNTCKETFGAEARDARRGLQRLRDAEQEFRDRRTVAAFRAEQRDVLKTVRQASRRFAEMEAERKRLGLPPEGRSKR
jgi:hypothetical protein